MLFLQEQIKGIIITLESSLQLSLAARCSMVEAKIIAEVKKTPVMGTARKTVPGPGPGAGGEEGCGRVAGVFIKARNAHPRPGSRLPRRRALGFSHISAFSRSTSAFTHSKEEGWGRATVSRHSWL